MENVKRIPYGVSNFVQVMEQNQYYVDKTMYLPLLEQQPDSLFFIRPRRFGKSIFLSMMEAYYDIAKKDKFQALFGKLWVGSHPTPLQGKYQVLHFDFSQIGGEIGALSENFNLYCRRRLDGFMETYIDAYPERLTSGFNIEGNISTDHQFNMMLGFSETDVREMLHYYKDAGQLPAKADIEAVIEEIKPWYGNYCFAKESLERDPKVFNCDMVYYYLLNYINSGKSPQEMIDIYTRTDNNRIRKLTRLDKLDGNRQGVQRKITEEGRIITTLETAFPATNITKPEIFPSMLFYYGMLTITATCGKRLELSIPNNNVRQRYYEFLLEEYPDKRHIST